LSGCHQKEKTLHPGDRITEMKQRYNLNDEQMTKITDIFADSRAKVKLLIKQDMADIKILKDKVNAGASDSDLTNVLETIKQDNQKIRDARISETDRIDSVLTPLQRAKEIISMSEQTQKKDNRRKKGISATK
jgi:Spy/CpxP family protein refolding chaperone